MSNLTEEGLDLPGDDDLPGDELNDFPMEEEEEKEGENGKAIKQRVTSQAIRLPAIKKAYLKIRIVSTTPMIQRRLGDKAMETIRDCGNTSTGKGKIKTPRVKNDPKKAFESSPHRHPETKACIIPARAFKYGAAFVAKRFFKNHAELIKCSVSFYGEDMSQYVTIMDVKGKNPASPKMDSGWARLPRNKVPIPVYRARFDEWSAILVIGYNPDLFNAESLATLVQYIGEYSGYGEMRPSQGQAGGENGKFEPAAIEELPRDRNG